MPAGSCSWCRKEYLKRRPHKYSLRHQEHEPAGIQLKVEPESRFAAQVLKNATRHNDRDEWRRANDEKMQTKPSARRPLQHDGWVLCFLKSSNVRLRIPSAHRSPN